MKFDIVNEYHIEYVNEDAKNESFKNCNPGG